MSQSTVTWDGCLNTRDLGGLPTTAGGEIRSNSLIRSDKLTYLTSAGIDAVRQHGISRIIDLRFPDEGASAETPAPPHPFANDVAYQSIPMFVPGEADLDATFLATATTAEIYGAMVDRHATRIAAAIAAIATAPPGPVVVHCADGKDRTGIVVALVLSVVGVANSDIAADYAASQERLASRLAILLEAEPNARIRELIERHWATEADTMLRLLDDVDERYGGAAEYLRKHGVDDATLSALRDRLLACTDEQQNRSRAG